MTIKGLEKKSLADYEGELDENQMRNGHGEEIHRRKHVSCIFKTLPYIFIEIEFFCIQKSIRAKIG